MSLQIWLPLNGDIHNQGLSNIQFSNTGATVSNFGKIGKCYSFNGSSNYIQGNYKFYNNKYSVCAWIYSTSSSATQTICCERTAVGSGFSTFLINGKLRIDPGGNNVQWTTNYTYPINTWFYLCVTYDGTTVRYYINGQFQESANYTIASSYWSNIISIGASQANGSNYANYLNGRLNDIRIYNHCLSLKEIKRVSRALTLHFKLDRASHLSSNIIKESSGYSNNGNGTLAQMTYPADTPRYKNAIRKTTNYVFVRIGNSSSITYNNGNNWMAQGSKEMTINLWAYSTDWTTNNDRLFSCTQSGGFAVYVSDGKLIFEIAKATNVAVTSYSYVTSPAANSIVLADLIAGWHMFSFIYNPQGFIIYIDGEYYSNYDFDSSYGFFYNLTGSSLNLGAESASATSATSPWFKGGESDFRLYYTALSADDIKELYKTSKIVSGTTVSSRNLE